MMFKWTVTFFIIAIMAAVFAYTTDIDNNLASSFKFIFMVSSALVFISMIVGVAIKRHKESE